LARRIVRGLTIDLEKTMLASRFAALALILVAASCATLDPATQAGSASVGMDEGVTIRVENSMPSNLRIYVLDRGGVTSLRTRTRTNGAIRLIARPSAGTSRVEHVSDPIQILPGQAVTWQLRFSPGVSGVPQMSTFKVEVL
jgi:hypothetical protein